MAYMDNTAVFFDVFCKNFVCRPMLFGGKQAGVLALRGFVFGDVQAAGNL